LLARDFKFEAAPTGQAGYEFCVGFRFPTAKLVVEVDDEESEAQIVAKNLEYPQERDGVCSAGDGHADTVTRRQHPRTADGFQHGLFQWCSHRARRGSLEERNDSIVAGERGRVEDGAARMTIGRYR
jgi:hypothetical protein